MKKLPASKWMRVIFLKIKFILTFIKLKFIFIL